MSTNWKPPTKEDIESAPPGYIRALKSRGVEVKQHQGPHVKQGGTYLFDPTKRTNRKAIKRRTVDYFGTVIRWHENRFMQKGLKSHRPIQPDPDFIVNLYPCQSYLEDSVYDICSKFVHTSANKNRCPINTMQWNPDGRRLITGLTTGEFTLWNGTSFNFESLQQAHDSAIRCMKWSHSGMFLASGDDEGAIKYWQTSLSNIKVFQAHKEAVRDLTFAPNDSKLATCSDDSTVRIWDFVTASEVRVLSGHGWDVRCIDWHPTKGLLASGSKDNLVKLWDPKSAKNLATLHGHKNTILGISWNRNGNWLVTASRDQLLRVYDVRTMRELQSFRGHAKDVNSVTWHPVHEGHFASGGSDGSLFFWDVGTEGAVAAVPQAHDSNIWCLQYHPMGHILATGSNDHMTRFWTRNRPGDAFDRSEKKDTMDMDDDVKEEGLPGLDGGLPGLGMGSRDNRPPRNDRGGFRGGGGDRRGGDRRDDRQGRGGFSGGGQRR